MLITLNLLKSFPMKVNICTKLLDNYICLIELGIQ